MKLNRTGSNWDRLELNKINENWDIIEGSYNDVVGQITDEVVGHLIDSAKLDWKEPVDTVGDLPANAEVGETRMVREADPDGISYVYRYDGEEWVKIQAIDVTLVNEVDNRLSAQLAQIVEVVDEDLADMRNAISQTYLLDKLYGVLNLFNKPSEFPMTIPFNVYTSLSGKVEHNYDVSTNKNPVTKRYYVDVNNGSNSNAGTEDAPFKSLERAFRYGDADEIILKPGIYDWANGTAGTAPISNQKKTFNLIGEGDVYLGAHRGYQTWTLVEGQSNVYHTSVSSVIEVLDIRNYANPLFYEKMNSISEVAGKSGSYYVNGSDVYVRTTNNAKPNEKILLNMANSALQADDFENIYMENIKFTNTFTMDNPNQLGRLRVKKCDFMFGTRDNSLSIFGEVYSILQECRAMYAERDGFNYHVRNGRLPEAIEIDCIGAYNGRDGNNSNNGSTMHDGGSILRINGEYHHNHGPNVIDVNPGTKSLNIGVHAHHSTATSSLSNVDFRTRDADMWLVNCVSHDSEYSTSREGNANLYKENSLLIGEEFVA